MARTALTYQNLVVNGSLADPAGTSVDATNSHVINSAFPERTVIRVVNTTASTKVVTVKGGSNPPAYAAGQGDMSVSLAAGNVTPQVAWLGPFNSAKTAQSGGALYVDIPSGMTGTITAFLLPKGV